MKKELDSLIKTYTPPICLEVKLVPGRPVCESGTLSKVSEGESGDDWYD